MNYFDDAIVRIFEEKNNLKTGGTLYRIPADKDKKFNFDYVLFVPKGIKSNTSLILTGPNYSAGVTINPEEKIEYMYENYKSFRAPIHYINQNTCFPILYPLIPRYFDEKLNEEIYTNMLSSNCFENIDNQYKRIDLQVINMLNDAKKRLKHNNIIVDDKIIIEGFSASAKFGNRFTLLHPEIVKLCICGGVGGFLTLPMKQYRYPVGIKDIEYLTPEKLEIFKNIKQFYYQGDSDFIDAFKSTEENNFEPYFKGVITEEELKQLYEVTARDLNKRWNKTQKIYNDLCNNTIFKTYKDTAHEYTKEIIEDIKEILEKEIEISN